MDTVIVQQTKRKSFVDCVGGGKNMKNFQYRPEYDGNTRYDTVNTD